MARSIEYTPKEKIDEYIQKDRTVIIPAAEAEDMRLRGRNLVARREKIISEKKPNYFLRRVVALGIIGVGSLIGIHELKNVTYHANETPREAAITRAYESHKKGAFKVLEGKIVIKPGATIRENPFIQEGSELENTNQVDPGKIIEGYDSSAEISIAKPIVMEDRINPANGMWYGFLVKDGDQINTYWTNGQNIIDRTKNSQVTNYNGKDNVGVLEQHQSLE